MFRGEVNLFLADFTRFSTDGLWRAWAMRRLTGATAGALDTTDPAIRLSHWRAPTVWMCWTTTSSPPDDPPTRANMMSPSRSRRPNSALHFMVFFLRPIGTGGGY